MLRPTVAISAVALMLCTLCGCGQSSDPTRAGGDAPVDVDRSDYVLAEEPTGAIGVISAREETQDQEEIVMVGRIGGRENPWIEGRAAFMMIDAAMTVVADGAESAENEICMDDCCAGLRAECTTLVKIVDADGKPLAIDTRDLLDVKENDMVVVTGKVQRDDDEGIFTIAADSVYLRR